jgi:16S rRNA (guanine527-N7)-methyltransferase
MEISSRRHRSNANPSPWDDAHTTALVDGAAGLGVYLTPTQSSQFSRYYAELVDWNQRINLTAITDPAQVLERLFLDSLTCSLAFPREPTCLSLIDIGAGAGFPGLPLKIARPEIRLTLVESVGKKAGFLRHIVDLLELNRVEVLAVRAEDAGQDVAHRAVYDVAVCRAVAELAVLAEYCLPLLREGGRLIAPKKTGIDLEVAAASASIVLLGGHLAAPVLLPDGQRQLTVIDKLRPTPSAYPRRPGMAAKRPLR